MIDPVAFEIFGFGIRWYGIAYFVTFLISLRLGYYLAKISPYIEKKDIDNFFNYAVFGVIIGGRLGYFLFYEKAENFLEFFYVWKGGMSFHGGVLGVIFSTFIYSVFYKRSPLAIADIVAICAPIGIFLGRIANFINQEILGTYSNLPWNFQGRHPVTIYESMLEGLLLFVFLFSKANKVNLNKKGLLFAYFLFGYSAARIICEFFKVPEGLIGPLSVGQFLSIPMFAASLVILYFIKVGKIK